MKSHPLSHSNTLRENDIPRRTRNSVLVVTINCPFDVDQIARVRAEDQISDQNSLNLQP
jgi:hypothetical protein